jgi:hypothetical protein
MLEIVLDNVRAALMGFAVEHDARFSPTFSHTSSSATVCGLPLT